AAIDDLQFPAPGGGCDVDGNGTIDEALNLAANDSARGYMNSWLHQDLGREPSVGLMVLSGLSDVNAQDDAFTFSFQVGLDTASPPDPTQFFTGNHPFYVGLLLIDASRQPLYPVPMMTTAGTFSTGPISAALALPLSHSTPVELRIANTRI